ncbi:hypothetical protein IX323_003159 [Bacteroides pyogenes]|nr:hypothetical protein [Bacteroides pyogenes]
MQRPALEAIAYLYGNADKHVIADIGVFAVHQGGKGGGAHTVQAFGRAVL